MKSVFEFVRVRLWLVCWGWKSNFAHAAETHGWLMQDWESPAIVEIKREFFWKWLGEGE